MRGDYYSDDTRSVVEFYSNFPDGNALVEWMRERPRASIRVLKVEGGDVAVVVPTADARGSLARNALRVFKGATVFLVESSGLNFNYGRSVNFGLEEAIREKPKWVIVSNDDVLEVDPFVNLLDKLSTLDHKREVLVHAVPGIYHSYPTRIFRISPSFPRAMSIFGRLSRNVVIRVQGQLYSRYGRKLGATHIVLPEEMMGPLKGRLSSLVGEEECRFLNVGSFGVMSRALASSTKMDETFLNSHEDVLLSLISTPEVVWFRIGERVGASLGTSAARYARAFANEVYFSSIARERDLCERWRVVEGTSFLR